MSSFFKTLKIICGFAEPDDQPSEITVREKASDEPVKDEIVIVEKKERKENFRITSLRDLNAIRKNMPSLPTVSEYPPQPRLVPAISVDEIMAIYAEEIFSTSEDFSMNEEEINAHLLPTIRRAAAYMHLLPASKFNHHNGVGGLIAHSLQVGKVAERIGKQKVFNRQETPKQYYHNGKRWLFACWLAGFLHDIGKLATDVIVSSHGETWDSRTGSLLAWLETNNYTDYSFLWLSGGHNAHQARTLYFIKDIVSHETLEWLSEFGSREIWQSCEMALINPAYTGENSMIAQVVMQADRYVSSEDLKKRNAGLIDNKRLGGSLPAAEFIMDALRLMVAEKSLVPNAAGSFLFITNIGVFLIWTDKTAAYIHDQLLKERHTSVPRQSQRMLDCLIAGEAVEPAPPELPKINQYLWPVVFESMRHPTLCIKLKQSHLIFNGLLPPEPMLALVNGGYGMDNVFIEQWENKFGKLPAQALPAKTENEPEKKKNEDPYYVPPAPDKEKEAQRQNDLKKAIKDIFSSPSSPPKSNPSVPETPTNPSPDKKEEEEEPETKTKQSSVVNLDDEADAVATAPAKVFDLDSEMAVSSGSAASDAENAPEGNEPAQGKSEDVQDEQSSPSSGEEDNEGQSTEVWDKEGVLSTPLYVERREPTKAKESEEDTTESSSAQEPNEDEVETTEPSSSPSESSPDDDPNDGEEPDEENAPAESANDKIARFLSMVIDSMLENDVEFFPEGITQNGNKYEADAKNVFDDAVRVGISRATLSRASRGFRKDGWELNFEKRDGGQSVVTLTQL